MPYKRSSRISRHFWSLDFTPISDQEEFFNSHRPLSQLHLPAPRHGLSGFFVGGFAALGFALVPVLLALGDGEFHLHPSIAKVQPRRNQRQPLLLGLAD